MNPYWAYGFGVDVPVTLPNGDMKMTPVTEALNCGSPQVVQRMLSDLGYDAGGSSGQFTNATLASIQKAAVDLNVAPGGSYPKGAFCTALANAWQAKRDAAKKADVSPPTAAAAPPAKFVLSREAAVQIGKAGGLTAAKVAKAQACKAAGGTATWNQDLQDYVCSGASGVRLWWNGLSTGAKAGIGIGVIALLGGAAYLLTRKTSTKATPNKRRKRRAACKCAGPCGCAKPNMAASQRPKTCRKSRPKGYPRNKGLYALPECWMYPLDSKKHVRAAASRFGKYKRRYSPAARAKIAAAIEAAERRFGIGKYH